MIKNFLLDLIFPRFCLGCKKELNLKQASFICEACLNNIVLNSGIQCHVCGLRNEKGTCRKCLKKMSSRDISRRETFLSGLYAAGKYQDPVLREAIHQFKYQGVESLKKPLAELLIKYLEKENLIPHLSKNVGGQISVLVPIPLTWRRKLSRGFNQSEFLVKELSPVLNCPAVNLLKRKKFAAPQARISDWQKRKENISGAFIINPSIIRLADDRPQTVELGKVKKAVFIDKQEIKKVVLIDDVSTSGATLEEAARVLKQAGVKEVYGLVIARG